MGWANCGQDSQGREIGYAHEATCDHPGCEEKIHRGLAYICGRVMHGECEWSCEKYFCKAHQFDPKVPSSIHELMANERIYGVCRECCTDIENVWKDGSFDTDIPENHRYGVYDPEQD